MSSPIDHTLCAAVAAILNADRPAGVDAAVSITADQETATMVRPALIALCENGESPHPRLRKVTLILRLRTRADEQDASDAAGWHQAAVDYFIANPASLYATLQVFNLRLKKFQPGMSSDEPDDRRGRIYEQRWTAVIQLLE